MTRKSELLRSKWPEFALDAAQWDIPAERMKMGKPHRVFLSRQAVEILRQVHELTGHGEYVFPSIFRGSVPMLAASPEPSDRDLSSAILRYVREMPVVRAGMARSDAQRELPGMTRSPGPTVTPKRTGPEMER